MTDTVHQRTLTTRREFTAFMDGLPEALRAVKLRPRRIRRSFLDTFDWRLFHAGLSLEYDSPPGTLRLVATGPTGLLAEAALPRPPRIAADVPDRLLRRDLKRFAEDRALLPLGTVEMRVSPWEITDAEKKVLAWSSSEQLLTGDGRGHTRVLSVRIRSLRGYGEIGAQLFENLQRGLEPPCRSAFLESMALLDRNPGDYSSRLHLPLPADMGARRALSRIWLHLLDLAERNLPGIEDDIDTEFLHDLRIALRRSRTLLTQVRGVYAPAEVSRFKEDFAWLSAATGGRRDLDVFLLSLPEYEERSGGPPHVLDPLKRMLEHRRAKEHQVLLCMLESSRFRSFLTDWQRFLREQERENGTLSPPLKETIGRSIRRAHRRVLRQGHGAGTGAYSESLHELRKSCKKLRYLLEAFRFLYPAKDVEEIIGQLRKLQNVLGDIVDFHVQESYLREWGTQLQAGNGAPRGTLEAIERLAGLSRELRAAAEGRFRGRFRRYTSSRVSAPMERLFGTH